MLIKQTGPGTFAAGTSLEHGGSLVDYALDAERSARPKRGDRFIHAHFLKLDVTRPQSDDDYEVRVITHVTDTEVYHIDAISWDDGHQPLKSYTMCISHDRFSSIVRRWI